MTLPNPLYEGTTVTTTVTFTDPTRKPVDPTTVTLSYQVEGGDTVTVDNTRVSVGIYEAELNTTSLPGWWTVKWVGTGTLMAVGISRFYVNATPI